MVKEIVVFIEGDSKQKGKYNSISLREGFQYFFSTISGIANSKGIKFRPIPCDSKFQTFKDFLNGIKVYKNSFVAFLIDSDGEVDDAETAKSFLQKQNENWRFDDVAEDQCHLMVQTMESWLIADLESLKNYYGQNFRSNPIPKHADCEKALKSDIEDGLLRATRDTTKGAYHKVKHGAELLRRLDVDKVKAKCKYCKRLFDVLEEQIEGNN